MTADGALALLGQAGLSAGEASRWRHVPPQLDCPAQRVARGAADLWWPAGREEGDHAPVTGLPGGARAVLALRERNGELRGVMEASWPEPIADFSAEVRQHLSALAAGCARILGARLALGDLAAAQPKEAVFTLLDDLADSVLVLRAIRDSGGQVADFSIEHVSPGYRDPVGRAGTDLTGLTLLEAYPASLSGQGLFARAVQVLGSGVPQHVPGPLGGFLGLAEQTQGDQGETRQDSGEEFVPLADLRAASFFDGVIVTWRHDDAGGQLAALLDHAQRLGRLGGWEENLVTGTVRWTTSAFDLFGLVPRPGTEIPLADLHSYVIAADKPVVKRFHQGLAEHQEAATATFRVVHPDDRGIRQIRVFAEPVVDADRLGGGVARGLPGRLVALPHAGRARRHAGPARGQRAARGGGATACAAVAAGHHAAQRDASGGGGDRCRRALPAGRSRASSSAATGTTRCCCPTTTCCSSSVTSRATALTR